MENKTWYCATSWSDRIKSKVVVRESESSIWFENGNRALKTTSIEKWFQTFEEAKNHKIALAKAEILKYERYIEEAKKKIQRIESIEQATI